MKKEINRLEEAVIKIKNDYNIPGLVVGVFKRGKIVFSKAYGSANKELNVPVLTSTQFKLGSISKSFTAAAILMLVEEKKLRLNDSISKFFIGAPSTWSDITVTDLLAHKSGIKDYLDDEFSKKHGIFDSGQDFSEAEMIKKSYRLPLEFRPGKKFSYSNTNYMLLGFIIHKITGKFYYQFIKEKILEPLSMNSVRIYKNSKIVYNRSNGYELSNGKIVKARFVSDTFKNTADGALYSDIFDMAKWDSELYDCKVLNRSIVRKMFDIHAPIKDSKYGYGFGWFINDKKTGKIVEHTGSGEGFTAVIKRDLGNKTTVSILTNLYRGDSEWILAEAKNIVELAKDVYY